MYNMIWVFNLIFCTDLYGLVLFLGVDPYWVKHWWDQLLYRPYRRGNTEPLYYVIAQLLWRSAKKDVIDQVGQEHFWEFLNKVLHPESLALISKSTDNGLKWAV